MSAMIIIVRRGVTNVDCDMNLLDFEIGKKMAPNRLPKPILAPTWPESFSSSAKWSSWAADERRKTQVKVGNFFTCFTSVTKGNCLLV